jgi:SNF family Na+-dependent transporter
MLLPFLVTILLLSLWAAYAIGRVVHRNLVNAGNPNATIIRIVTTIGCWIVITAAILALIYFNVSFER